MHQSQLKHDLKTALKELGFTTQDLAITSTEDKSHGDYATNIALQLSKQEASQGYQSPRDIANAIIEKIGNTAYLEKIELAGPGFINFSLKDDSILKNLDKSFDPKEKPEDPKRFLVEYADPNTHKEFHLGHLRPLFIGESISRLFEYQGIDVYRANYGSDIGPTVGKALFGISQLKDEYELTKKASLREKSEFLGKAYALGHKLAEESSSTKSEIEQLTKDLYERKGEVVALWEETKLWSLAYFESIFTRMGVEYDRRINESEIDQLGKKVVLENTGSENKVFSESEGAIIFRGEDYGLHTRVFLTAAGNPTYEAKEVGLVNLYQEIYPFDELLILSDVQQRGFFEVVNKAIELIYPDLDGKKKYLGFGFVSLSTGKMSSREGNVISAETLIDLVKAEVKSKFEMDDSPETQRRLDSIVIGAIKFAYLKYAINSDIAFDIESAISLQGDTGPYVMYTYARIRSLLEKANTSKAVSNVASDLEAEEREVLRQLEYFSSIVKRAADTYQPNELTNYLLTLAKAYNLAYEKYPVIGSDSQELKLKIALKVSEAIKQGLYLLGIDTVERM